MINDLGLVVIKPEAFERRGEVLSPLEKRGYTVVREEERGNWLDALDDIHSDNIPLAARQILKLKYLENGFGNSYTVLLVKHEGGDTIRRLLEEKGHAQDYEEGDGSLRGEFGTSKEYITCHNGTQLSFPGIHTAKDRDEMGKHMKIFGMNDSDLDV